MCPEDQNQPESLRISPFSALSFLPQELQDEINSIEALLSRSSDNMPQRHQNLFPFFDSPPRPEHTRNHGVIGKPATNNLDNPVQTPKPRSPSPVYFLPKDLMDEINGVEIESPRPDMNGGSCTGERPMIITLPAANTSMGNFTGFSLSYNPSNEFSSSCNISNNTNGYVLPPIPYTMQSSILRPIFNTSYINNASLQTSPNPEMEQIHHPIQHCTPRPILHKNYIDDQINPVTNRYQQSALPKHSPRPILNRNCMDALPMSQNIVEDPCVQSEVPYIAPIYVLNSNYSNGYPSQYLLQNSTANQINPVMNCNGEFVEPYALQNPVTNQPLNGNCNGEFQASQTESAIPLLSGYCNGDFHSTYVVQNTEELKPALSGSCNGEFQATYVPPHAVENQLNAALQNTNQHPQFPVPSPTASPVLDEMCNGESPAPNSSTANPQTQPEVPPSAEGPVFDRNFNGEFLVQTEQNSFIIKHLTQLDVPCLTATPLFNINSNGELPAAYKLQNLIIDRNSLTKVVDTYMQFILLPSTRLINYQTVPGQQNFLTNPTTPNTQFTVPLPTVRPTTEENGNGEFFMPQSPANPINQGNGINPAINYTNPYMLSPSVPMLTPEGNCNGQFMLMTQNPGNSMNYMNGILPMINDIDPYMVSPQVVIPPPEENYNEFTLPFMTQNPGTNPYMVRPKSERNYNGEFTRASLPHNAVNNQLHHTKPRPKSARPITNKCLNAPQVMTSSSNCNEEPPKPDVCENRAGFIKQEPSESDLSDASQE